MRVSSLVIAGGGLHLDYHVIRMNFFDDSLFEGAVLKYSVDIDTISRLHCSAPLGAPDLRRAISVAAA